VMVFAMVAITSIFFLVVDGGLAFLANQFLKLAG
jgi:preprotein translocase subunit SecE